MKKFLHQLFCRHYWLKHSVSRFQVLRADKSIEGEVTLTLMECPLCGKDYLIPSDRIHFPKPPEQPNDAWIDYLKETGNLQNYDGLCDCYSCRRVRENFEVWKYEKLKNKQPSFSKS